MLFYVIIRHTNKGVLMPYKTKYIYIILTQSGTNISKTIKLFTNAPFNHSSITDDSGLKRMFSFARFHRHLPLPAGFMHEKINEGVFGMYNTVPCEIYAIPISKIQHGRFLKLISHFKEQTHLYSYNLLGLITMPLGIPFRRRRRFVCSQFVAFILKHAGIADFKKDISLITPEDLRYVSDAKLIFSGNFKEFCATDALADGI